MNCVTSSIRVFLFGRAPPSLISVGTAAGLSGAAAEKDHQRPLKGGSLVPIQK